MKYKAVIVEDDPLSHEILVDLINDHFHQIELVGHFSTVAEATEGIDQNQVDLVFLDMELPDGKGFDVLSAIGSIDFEVIITTMHDSYMLEAIKHSAIDYLMKPVTKQALADALIRFEQRISKSTTKPNQEKSYASRMAIPNQEGLILVEIAQIIRLASDGAYTVLHLTDGRKLMTSKNLGFYQTQLNPEAFVRVHHGHIIHIPHIKNYVRGEGGHVVMTDNSEVSVSRRKKEEFLAALGV